MKIKEITDYLEQIAPLAYAESFDNVGLLVGNFETELTNVLVCLDSLENVIDEAIEKKCNLIISFHPIIFSGLKKLNGNTYVERVVLKAIKHDIAIYASHTALDNSIKGVSAKMAEIVGLKNTQILQPKKGLIKKLTTYVPIKDAEKVRAALHDAGAGSIGNYDACSFNIEGEGTFRPNANANPVKGEQDQLHIEKELFISVIFEKHLEFKILQALIQAHPYEEVAYDIVNTDNFHQHIGMGILGELAKPCTERFLLDTLKKKFKLKVIRHSKLTGRTVKKVALLGGSGSFAIESAISKGADIYITADLKYHDFFRAEEKILLADIGHYESEQFTKNLIVDYLTKKFRNFAIILSEKNTNPINYL